MGMGCAASVFLFLIIFLISPILFLINGETDGMGFALVASGLSAWALYSIFKSAGKEDTTKKSSGYKPAEQSKSSYPSSSSKSYSSKSSDNDDLPDAAIAAGLAYTMFSSGSDSDDDFDDDDDKDDWDDDMEVWENDKDDWDDDWDDDW